MPLDPHDLLARFDQAAQEKGFSKEEITPSIPAYSRRGTGPLVLLSAGIHGDEPASPLAALEFLSSNPSPDFSWLLTPLLNPTGLAAGTRENHEGLDLNRDYHQPQSSEVQAHCAWLERQATPDLFIALHEDYDATGFYFYEIQTGGHPSLHSQIFEKIRPHLPIEPGPLIDGRESSGEGWFFRDDLPALSEFVAQEGGYPEALFLAQKGCPLSLTFETPTHAAPLKTRISAHLAAISASLDGIRTF